MRLKASGVALIVAGSLMRRIFSVIQGRQIIRAQSKNGGNPLLTQVMIDESNAIG